MAILGQVQFRRDTSTNWTTNNPILLSGELGLETDTDLFKIGNGTSAWNSLPYGGIQGAPGTNGTNGTNGRGIVSITRTAGNGSAGTTDTYTITYTDSTTSTFTVVNGANGAPGTNGTNGTNGTDGRGIVSIVRTAGNGAVGTTDTYTITYTDSTTSTFTVVNGAAYTDEQVQDAIAASFAAGTSDGLQVTYNDLNNSFSSANLDKGSVAFSDTYTRQRTTLTNATTTTETILARWTLPANTLVATSAHEFTLIGQVSGTATLTFRVRVGTAGTTADPVAATFAATAAGVANTHVNVRGLLSCLTTGTTGTVTAGGNVHLGAAVTPVAVAAFSAATVNTTVQQFVSITVVQSAAQTLTVRGAFLDRVS
jgi:Major tropism determinant N-terminal domain